MIKQNDGYNIGLYVRNSDPKQDTPEGTIKNQEERLREVVKLKNLSGNFGTIQKIYVDRSLSAKDLNRPELQKMLADIASKTINLVMVTELSRITRSIYDFVDVWQLFKDSGCGFLSLRENVDTSNAAGEMIMFNLVNFAQFERRQTQERVTANLKARAKRGLYNGGIIPLGYKRIPDKPGYLEIDKPQAEIIKVVFNAFLKNETISRTSKYLNDKGIKIKREIEGGGFFNRLEHFSIENLQHILRNKAYIGIRTYKDGDSRGEAKAVWPAIIDETTFERVQALLDKNYRKNKSTQINRYPYILSGLTYCLYCGDVMCGKSAHGNAGKVGYYEHSWATKRDSTLSKKIFSCNPQRVPAKKLEPLILNNLKSMLSKPQFAERIINKARELHEDNSTNKDIKRLKVKIISYKSQLDALVERLSELPKSISASLIYKQMEKIEGYKTEAENRALELEKESGKSSELPVNLSCYKSFLELIRKIFSSTENTFELQAKIIKKLIHKIEIGIDKVKIHYYAGKDYINQELADLKGDFENFLDNGSNTLTFGADERT